MLVWLSRKDEDEEVMSSFSSLFFDVVTATTTTNAAPADALTKDGSEKEAADETAGGNRLFHKRRMEEVE